MHALKILLLLLLTLAAMRVVSWLCLWLLRRVLKRDAAWLALGANLLALCAFAVLLRLDAVPGELLDLRALAFGVIVFAVFFAIDLKWVPGLLSRGTRQ
jgi:hypothetical protein